MSRRRRQFEELRDLCRSGRAARAVDLAFEHFAAFGRDDQVLDLLVEAIDRAEVPEALRRRLAELDDPAGAGERAPVTTRDQQ